MISQSVRQIIKYTIPSHNLELFPLKDPASHDFSSPCFSAPILFLSMIRRNHKIVTFEISFLTSESTYNCVPINTFYKLQLKIPIYCSIENV